MRLVEGFSIYHDAMIEKELQGRFEIKGGVGSDAVISVFPFNELRIKLCNKRWPGLFGQLEAIYKW